MRASCRWQVPRTRCNDTMGSQPLRKLAPAVPLARRQPDLSRRPCPQWLDMRSRHEPLLIWARLTAIGNYAEMIVARFRHLAMRWIAR